MSWKKKSTVRMRKPKKKRGNVQDGDIVLSISADNVLGSRKPRPCICVYNARSYTKTIVPLTHKKLSDDFVKIKMFQEDLIGYDFKISDYSATYVTIKPELIRGNRQVVGRINARFLKYIRAQIENNKTAGL